MARKICPVGTTHDIEVKEIAAKWAPDGGETVLPLVCMPR
jgi:hypothetical protein